MSMSLPCRSDSNGPNPTSIRSYGSTLWIHRGPLSVNNHPDGCHVHGWIALVVRDRWVHLWPSGGLYEYIQLTASRSSLYDPFNLRLMSVHVDTNDSSPDRHTRQM